MAEIINLNQYRKRRAGAEKKRAADENAARAGETKFERGVAESQAESERRRLDGHRLNAAPEPDQDLDSDGEPRSPNAD